MLQIVRKTGVKFFNEVTKYDYIFFKSVCWMFGSDFLWIVSSVIFFYFFFPKSFLLHLHAFAFLCYKFGVFLKKLKF